MQTAFEQPRFSELPQSHKLRHLFHRLGDISPVRVSADDASGAGSHALGIWVLTAVSAGADLPINERYRHAVYALRLTYPVLCSFATTNDSKRDSLNFTTSPERGLTVNAYDVVGWGRSRRGKVGPVVDAINAPSGCIQRTDVVEWFEIGEDA